MTERANLNVVLCAPRGFCAGVDRAIQIVEIALEKFGAPVYVRHEIVHNRYVVTSLEEKGAVFVEELEEIEEDDRPVIFSAHGVPKDVKADAAARNFFFLDATCPLVSKVHKEAEIHFKRGREIILIGHAGHPEVVGTMGQLPDGAVTLVETVRDVVKLAPQNPDNLAWISQTTLSVDDTRDIVAALGERFPSIVGPHKDDICYATTNRQEAVKAVASDCDAMIIVGAPNSSNSQRLREVALRAGCRNAKLIQRAAEIDLKHFAGIKTLGISAGASAPEALVEEVLDRFAEAFDIKVTTSRTADESIEFALPRALRDARTVQPSLTESLSG
ncbi:4-hydroxy-3-methylbut-2-enyl diphosphate reductase [Acuticoccus sp. I52.16.1]|uniref:4-hydroxy-3-methylbut-2-enyl diphosphate reductase n=1 Tax=Acuticoccus sp. I52.16.1 TaxID=2928472 RepID=UPI001FD41CA3|nr:4-hydroxy-3-methylbut-2-enyl diphosphate reductase [Acuticoccus sp. I52.16.1]UOM36988.1 4-hydroxy-3-methylbut-2-enyl diphosphate reductase [Acuticoccus sp. I52.16.1]